MGIVSYCPNGHRTKLKDRFAGLRVRCPECGAKFVVTGEPAAATDDDAADSMFDPVPDTASLQSVPPMPAAIAEAADASWCIAVPGGEPSPPRSAAEMQTWLEAGTASGGELVWRSDWADWKPIGLVFPEFFASDG